MNLKLLFLLPLLLCFGAAAQTPFDPDKSYHQDSLKRWTKNIMKEISLKHPGFYRYTPKTKFDARIDSTINSISSPLTELEYYRKLKPLFAIIGCLHTGVSLSKDYQNYLNTTPTLIPVDVFIDSTHRVLVTRNYAQSNLPIGGELRSINGKPTQDILRSLLAAIPSDGYNTTEKTLLLNHRFAFWYQSIIELNTTFQVDVLKDGQPQKYKLEGVSKSAFPYDKSLQTNYNKPLEFEIKENTAILKVHTFAKTEIKNHGQHFRKYIKHVFKELKHKQVQNLIIDLRYNSGGSDGNAVFLAAHFFDQPFRYWEKIEVTEALAREIKGMTRLVYKKPRRIGDSYLWRKSWVTSEFDYYQRQKPARQNFKGKTILLTNGLCMSSCSDFVAILSHNKKAIVVGQETGGGYQGNTSGIMPTTSIPTGLRISIPLQKYTNAVDLNKNFGHGARPDIETTITFEEWIGKRDVEMEKAGEYLRVKN